MKRNIIAVICLMLAITFVFVGCTKYKYYTDGAGNKHIAYTDKNGETVTHKSGAPIIIPTNNSGEALTDKKGEYITEIIDTTGINISSNGKKIETSAYKLTVPKGWVIYSEIDSYAQLRLENDKKENKTKIDISFSTQDYQKTVDAIAEIQKTFIESADEVLIDTKEEITLKNGEISPVTLFTFLGSVKKDDKEVISGFKYYVIKNNSYTFLVFCGLNSKEDVDSIDFESVINSIEFK